MVEISWKLVLVFTLSGVAMALLSCLVGLRPKIEIPLWWLLYAIWIAITVALRTEAPFRTLLLSSLLAGLCHGTTTAILLDRYIANNPWHAAQMSKPKAKLAFQFVFTGIVIGIVFGAIVAGIGWAIHRM